MRGSLSTVRVTRPHAPVAVRLPNSATQQLASLLSPPWSVRSVVRVNDRTGCAEPVSFVADVGREARPLGEDLPCGVGEVLDHEGGEVGT